MNGIRVSRVQVDVLVHYLDMGFQWAPYDTPPSAMRPDKLRRSAETVAERCVRLEQMGAAVNTRNVVFFDRVLESQNA